MSSNFRKVKYTTLSPLHIGDGNTLGSFEYFVHNGKIYFYKSEDLKRIFDQNQMDEFINYAINEQSPSFSGFFKDFENQKEIFSMLAGRSSYSLNFWGNETPSKVWTFIKSRNKPYIPGSEIKGAIRTAVLRKLISTNHEMDILRKALSELKFKRKENISTEILRIRQQRGDRPVWDAKFDFMKFLFVSDISVEEVKPFVAKVENKNTSKSGDYHEIIPQNTEFQGEIQVSNGRQFQEFTRRYQADNERKTLFTGFERILEACFEMTNAILDEEIAFYSEPKLNMSVVNQLKQIREANTEHSPVIRIGKHQGFMSLTLATLVKKLGDRIFREYAESLISLNKKIYPNNFPKTRKVLVNSAKEELTLGWVKIEVE